MSFQTNLPNIVLLPSVEEAKSEKKKDIEKKRLSLEESVISYTGKNLDADAEALKNINGKIKELDAREVLAQPIDINLLFWRDADNVIHTWQDVTNYKNWLQGLVIAIAERSTKLYAKSWQKKAEIDSLTDINEILSYDTSTNWELD